VRLVVGRVVETLQEASSDFLFVFGGLYFVIERGQGQYGNSTEMMMLCVEMSSFIP
jgi:hypothetical protein